MKLKQATLVVCGVLIISIMTLAAMVILDQAAMLEAKGRTQDLFSMYVVAFVIWSLGVALGIGTIEESKRIV